MENTVIKVLTPEHGKRVIEFFKEKNVNTKNKIGICCERDGDEFIYYGVIEDEFSNYSLSCVRSKGFVKIIELSVNFNIWL